jgi:hypothetical protein
MDRMKVAVVEELLWNSTMILGMPGANIDEPYDRAVLVSCASKHKPASMDAYQWSGGLLAG